MAGQGGSDGRGPLADARRVSKKQLGVGPQQIQKRKLGFEQGISGAQGSSGHCWKLETCPG